MQKENLLKAVLITAGLYSLNAVINLLTGISLPAPFLLSLFAAYAYLMYSEAIDVRETVLASAAFIAAGLLTSHIAKIYVYEDLCQMARSVSGPASGAAGLGSIMDAEKVCLSTLEIFVSATSSGPFESWQFWLITLTASTLSIYLYRKHYKANSGTIPESEPSSNTSP